jgi:putative oxidoreductase
MTLEDLMRNYALLATRLVLGSYLAVHGAQKLFGSFGGPGLEKAGAGFDRIGLSPGKQMAAAAGITELGGGLLTVAGIADPAGPLAIVGAMSIAATTHRAKGPLSAKGGFELPLTNLAAATALVAAGPGKFRLGPPLPRPLAVAATVGGGLLAAGLVAKMLTAAPAAPATPASQAESAGQAQSAGQAESAGQASPQTTAPAGIPGNPRPAWRGQGLVYLGGVRLRRRPAHLVALAGPDRRRPGAVAVAVLAPLLWLSVAYPLETGMFVIDRSAVLLIHHGSPYLPSAQVTSWQSYNPYLPVMTLFGLPSAAGLAGWRETPAYGWRPGRWPSWPRRSGSRAAPGLRLVPPRRPAGPGDRGRLAGDRAQPGRDHHRSARARVHAAGAGLAAARRGGRRRDASRPGCPDQAVWSGAALGVACDLKSTAWLAVPVMAAMFAARDGARAADGSSRRRC